MGDAAESALGTYFRSIDAGGVGYHSVRQSGERPERSHAARHLHADAYYHIERPDADITQFLNARRQIAIALTGDDGVGLKPQALELDKVRTRTGVPSEYITWAKLLKIPRGWPCSCEFNATTS